VIASVQRNLYVSVILWAIQCVILCLATQSMSVGIFQIFLMILIYLQVKDNVPLFINLFVIGQYVILMFYLYWIFGYENSYFLGLKSDDYYFDVIWSSSFLEKYGINPFKLPQHLNSIEPGLGVLHNSKGYVYLIIVLKHIGSFIGGYNTLLPRVLNMYFLTMLAFKSSEISFVYFKDKKLSVITSKAVFFFPVLLFVSAHIFRDTLIAYLLVSIFENIKCRKISIANILATLIFLLPLFFLRTTTFVLAIIIAIFLYMQKEKIDWKLILLAAVGIYVFIILLPDNAAKTIREIEGYTALNKVRFGTYGTAVFSLPFYAGFIPRIVYLVTTPVPSVTSFYQFFVSLSTYLQLMFLPYLIRGLVIKNQLISLKIVFLLFFLGVAFTTADFRHVTMYIPFMIILALGGWRHFGMNRLDKYVRLSSMFFILMVVDGLILFL